MKTKSLTYSIETKHLVENSFDIDFLALLRTGRMLNALGTAAEACRETYNKRDHGYRCAEDASFLGRLCTEMLTLVREMADLYANEECFAHFREMFSGDIRDFRGTTMAKMRLPEFRLISRDPAVSKLIRELDVLGVDILFPREREQQAEAFRHEARTQYEFGRYSAIRPNDRYELQHLVRYYTCIYDFSIGAEIFIKAMAKRLGLKPERVSKRSAEKATVGSNA